jgi:hypothetical protein
VPFHESHPAAPLRRHHRGSSLAGAANRLPVFKAEHWVNSAPLTAEGLRDKVVLVDF